MKRTLLSLFSFRMSLFAGCLLFGLLLGSAAFAHDFWIHPTRLKVALGQPLSLDLRVGHPLDFESVVRSRKLLKRFIVVDALGEREVLGREGRGPAGLTRSRTTGPLLAVYAGEPQPLELSAEKFESYLREEGLEAIVEWRKQHGESEAPGRERYSRCAKTLLQVETDSAAGETDQGIKLNEGEELYPADEVRGFDGGLKLELFPPKRLPEAPEGTHSKAQFELRYDGKPIAGVLVRALHLYRPNVGFEARTSELGRVEFDLKESGPWLLKAVHMERSGEVGFDWESYWASLLLELPAPVSAASSSK